MSRPDPIQYAERLYAAIRAANFSPISFLAFGNAVKDGVELRRMPRIAAEPFMRVVGEMLDLEQDAEHVLDGEVVTTTVEETARVAAAPSVSLGQSDTEGEDAAAGSDRRHDPGIADK